MKQLMISARNNFPSLFQSVPILNLWWKSSPKMRHHVRSLQTVKICFFVKIPNFISYVTRPIGLILLPLANNSCMHVHCCNFPIWSNFSGQTLIITDFDASVSRNVNSFFLFIIVWKSTVIFMNLDYFLGTFWAHIWYICGAWVRFADSGCNVITGYRFFYCIEHNTRRLVCCQICCIYIHPSAFTIINVHTVAANINVTVHIKSAFTVYIYNYSFKVTNNKHTYIHTVQCV